MFKIEKMEWADDLSVGIAEIDNQHKELFARLNNLIDAVEVGSGEVAVVDILKFLEDYVVFHFGAEEEFMKEESYPGYEAHRNQHKVFMNTLDGLKDKYKVFGVTPPLMELLQSQICGWILTHIRGSDMQFGDFLVERG